MSRDIFNYIRLLRATSSLALNVPLMFSHFWYLRWNMAISVSVNETFAVIWGGGHDTSTYLLIFCFLLGVFVDAVNSMGQTSLFIAALLGLGKIVDILLDYGSDANHRCYDGSTPVHAAAFSGNQWILSRLLDEGGDLRVHDKNGKKPQCWAMSADKETSAQILKFIQRCTSHMQAAIQNFPSDLLRKVGSSKALVYSPSRFGSLVQGNVDSPLGRFLKGGANAAKNIYSFGFGKFYLAGSGHLEYLASLLIIGEKDLVQADDEPAFSYHVGPYMIMTNLMWGGSRVTVKELGLEPHQNCSKLRFADLLVAEQEHGSKLRHPHLLQLMAVCLSSDLEKTRLVYERVNLGSLYSILHERRTEFPVLHMEIILHVLLQIINALRFLHSRGFIHRSVTSYAIQIVSSGEAKLCNLEYMIESKDGGEHSDLTRIPVPVQLYKWCSPEVILEKVVTVKSDIYSFCAVVQEALTETPPWKGCEDSVIKQLIISGQQLEADVRLPVPYYDIVKSGLEPKQKNRSMNLQDIQYILKNDLKDLLKSQTGHADEMPKAQRPVGFADVNICLVSAFSSQKKTQEFQGKEITKADISTSPIYSVFPEEKSALVPQEASANLHTVAQDENQDVASELEMTPSLSDVDDSLCSFEINEIFASFPEPDKEFLEERTGLGQTLKDEKRQQKEEDKATFKDLSASPGVHCEEKSVYEEDSFSESDTEYSTEAQESMNEASDLAQVRDAGRLVSNLSRTEQHISKCVLSVKISQSMVQQIADSLCRLEEKLDKSEATKNQNKLLQEVRMNQLSEQNFQGHWNRSDDTSQNTDNSFSGANTFSWKAIGPPSRNYVPPGVTCQAQGPLGGGGFQAVSKTAMEVFQNEKWKCFHEMNKSKNENNHYDLTFTVVKNQDDQVSLDHEGHSRELPSSFNSCSDVSEEFFTPDYFLPSTAQTSDAEGKLEDACGRFLQKQLPEDAGSGIQVSGGKTLLCSTAVQKFGSNMLGVNQLSRMPVSSVEAAQEITQEECQEKDVSVTDIHNLSNIPYEQESCTRDVDCKTPRVSHAPRSFSTPLSSEEKNPIAFEKYKRCHEVASDSSFCSSQEISAASRIFTTPRKEGRSTEIPSVASGVCSSALNQPDGLPVVASCLRGTRKASALSQASNHFTDELPPPAQELLDEIEYLKQQDSSAQDFEENGLYDCGVQINVPDQIQMEDRESRKESERNEEGDHSLWTKESFNLSEETERAHSTLDGILERMIHAVPGDEEIQEQPEGHALWAIASLQDPEDVGRKKGAGATNRAPGGCAGSSEGPLHL
ncbi:inactive serine/threonine-protein kinase TEX14 isoform X8 [Strigops habroptila]|uniref:inactive serine/threonine-protein kinase TEX14 isoform X8 n=1 Tax=Strigops habroptila TaxID=2489341 RepID=UPI0011CF0521|nr:inactive serine/threonine-protein kinase TEX14 isoform X8 [Strigops habroptila]